MSRGFKRPTSLHKGQGEQHQCQGNAILIFNLGSSLFNIKFNKAIEKVEKARVMSQYIKSWSPFSSDRHENFLFILMFFNCKNFRRPLFIKKTIYKIYCHICFQGKKILQFLFHIQYLLDLIFTPFLFASFIKGLIISLFYALLLFQVQFKDIV